MAEKEGTFTNTERRCVLINKAIEPVGESLSDWEIICRLSSAMGYDMSYNSSEEIFQEMTSLTQSYGGMTYERLGINGLQWPCPNTDHPGTQYLHKQQFPRPSGKGKFHAISYIDPAESPDEKYPYYLTTGRMFSHYHTGTMTRISPKLDNEQKTGYVDMCPEDADDLGISDNDTVVISSRRGEIEVPVRLNDTVVPGTLFLPIHFGENPTNVLTSSDAFDPLAKIPEFKVSSVNVKKLLR